MNLLLKICLKLDKKIARTTVNLLFIFRFGMLPRVEITLRYNIQVYHKHP